MNAVTTNRRLLLCLPVVFVASFRVCHRVGIHFDGARCWLAVLDHEHRAIHTFAENAVDEPVAVLTKLRAHAERAVNDPRALFDTAILAINESRGSATTAPAQAGFTIAESMPELAALALAAVQGFGTTEAAAACGAALRGAELGTCFVLQGGDSAAPLLELSLTSPRFTSQEQ